MIRLIDPIELKKSIAYSNMVNDGKTLEQIIDEQPTVNQWIPCSERLPELRHNVLLTVFFHEAWQTVEGYRQDGEFMFWHNGILDSVLDEENRVTAWMEKPEPYKGGE